MGQVVVTGGAGVIGMAVCRRVRGAGARGGALGPAPPMSRVGTGGAGVIGMAICRRLRDAGSTAVAMDLAPQIASVDWDAPGNRGIQAVEGDVTDRASVEAGG